MPGDQPTCQSGQPDRVGGAHDHDLVGDRQRAEGQLVAAGPGDQVAGEVVLETEPGVDDDVAVGARDLEQVLHDARPHLDPAVGSGQTGDDGEVVAQGASYGAEVRLEIALRRSAGRR